jgi:hypothetical protein
MINSVCSRCGQPATWLVSLPYSEQSSSGRLLVYCDACRVERAEAVAVALPLSVLAHDIDGILTWLYEEGFTLSDPRGAAAVLQVPAGSWVARAEQILGSPT